MPNGTSRPPTGSTSAKGQEPGRGAGSIEERWRAVEKAVAVYGMAEADVMGVPEVMPEVAVKAAADLRNAQREVMYAVLDSQHTGGDHSPACGCMEWEDVADRCANYRILHARIKAL